MTFKHIVMLVLIIAKYRLRQKLFFYDTVNNRQILAMFFYFALLQIYIASKILEQTTCTNKLLKKNNFKCGSSAPGLPNYNQVKIGT